MPAIAVIGPDGAGKTTLTRRLESSGLLPFKYLYMGVSTSSSNVALPTSRLVEYFKPPRRDRPSVSRPGNGAAGNGSGPDLPEARARREEVAGRRKSRRGGRRRGPIWAAGRLANRLAEQWYRQLLSWSYQLRGYTVLYDRHFIFDFGAETFLGRGASLDRRLHRWFLEHLYPRPDLVIFLDAPGEVLYARKGESTPEELERRRQMFLRVGCGLPGFIRVDATRPLNEVYDEIAGHVERFCSKGVGEPVAEVTG